ncbi:hypothetical protein Trydic_g23884 [Trypoxylus dichotomus]
MSFDATPSTPPPSARLEAMFLLPNSFCFLYNERRGIVSSAEERKTVFKLIYQTPPNRRDDILSFAIDEPPSGENFAEL